MAHRVDLGFGFGFGLLKSLALFRLRSPRHTCTGENRVCSLFCLGRSRVFIRYARRYGGARDRAGGRKGTGSPTHISISPGSISQPAARIFTCIIYIPCREHSPGEASVSSFSTSSSLLPLRAHPTLKFLTRPLIKAIFLPP